MANYVTIKKKFNVPVFVVLLIFAFVPGIIYFIWSRFPTKICTDPEKGFGGKMRIISAAIAFAPWVLVICIFPAAWMSFAMQVAFSLASLVMAILAKKNNNKLLLILNIVFAVATIGVSIWMFYYNWFVSVVAPIVTIVGCVKGINHYNYHKLGKGKDDEEEEDEDEDEE